VTDAHALKAVDAVPPLRGADPGAGVAARRLQPASRPARQPIALPALPPVVRRTVLQTTVALGTAVGMAAIGLFPAARRAYADGYTIYGSCPSYAADHDCSPGCGPSTIFGAACNTSGTYTGFHKNDGVTWTLRPNQCYASVYDGWLWRYGAACGTCACYVERRCHDGYRYTGSGWVKSICRWNTDCGCQGPVTWRITQRGDTGPNVYTVQHLLVFRGAAISIDGIFGAQTEAAVMAFQQTVGLAATGVVGAETWPALIVVVRRYDSNQAVRGAQRQLNKYGYALVVDGIFGVLTDGAVRDFQLQSALTVDGVVGLSTWRTLEGGAGV
jgi:hypothetical protein